MHRARGILVALILLLLVAAPVYGQGPPQLPNSFFGDVTINGGPAPVGTKISATGEGVTTDTVQNPVFTTIAGTYGIDSQKLLVQGDISDGTTITFEEDTAWNFPTPTPTAEFTWQATNIFKFLDTPLTEQWVRLKLVKAGGFDPIPQVATILCGKYAELNRRFAPVYEIGEEDFSEFEYSDSQVLFAQEKETLNVRHYSYQALDTASVNEIFAMFKECKTIKAFAFCHDYSDPNPNTLWVRNSELNPPVCRNGVWYWDMAIMEIV